MKYRITPINPIISRDARQYGAGSPMHSLKWFSQGLIAGAIRSVLWKIGAKTNMNDEEYDHLVKRLREIEIKSSFPIFNGEIYFPRPLDILKNSENIYQIKPHAMPKDSGTNMPINGLLPAMPDELEKSFKPEKINEFWKKALMTKWLKNGKENFNFSEESTLSAPAQDERIRVRIDSATGTSKDGQLFSTTGLDLIRKNAETFEVEQISIDVNTNELPEKFIAPLGGERRLAEFTRCDEDKILWSYPKELPKNFSRGDKLRMILATPAIFDNGWLPGWIDKGSLIGNLPNTNAKVKLVSAITDRWLPISGWGYERRKTGPKAMQRAVPSGSVYFFEVVEGEFNPSELWLKSVCDENQNINDGFGLVLIGKW